MSLTLRTGIALLFATCLATACVVYDPYYYGSKYDRSWSAALGGVQDAGVSVTHADPENGTIRGNKNGIDVTVWVDRQVDGGVRVKFDAKGDTGNDPQLSQRFSQAYERRMGR